MDENAPPINAPPPLAPPPAGAVPPPLPPPPVISPPGAPQRPRRGRGWMVLALVLLVLLAFSVLYNLSNFASNLMRGKGTRHYGSRTWGPKLEEVMTEDNESANKIAIVEVEGIITGRVMDQGGFSMVELLKAQLKRAEEDKSVKGVILKVDSPGGEVLASDDMAREISDFQNRTRRPVIASMGSLAASGGYYISSPCRWIVANDLTITGSIGVIMSSYNYRHLMDKVGVLPQTYKSGKFKDMLSGSRDPDSIPPEEQAMVQSLINETYQKFKNVVQTGRENAHRKNKDNKDKGRALSDDWQDYADGRVLSGTEAFKLGFVDELGGFDDAVQRAKKIAGIAEANLIQYQQHYDFSDLFKLFGKSEPKSLKVDMGMELPKIQAGQLYFLSPSFVH